jgi:hypothetical protein
MLNIGAKAKAAPDAVDFHRSAYNAAFYELGLKWHWDAEAYQAILPDAKEKDHIQAYLETHQGHLLTAYDPGFLADAIQAAKERCYDALVTRGEVPPDVDWAAIQQAEIGV